MRGSLAWERAPERQYRLQRSEPGRPRIVVSERGSSRPSHGVFNCQCCLSLLGSNFDTVAKLLPTAESASGSFEFGIDFGMMRQAPSGSCSIRHNWSGAPVKPGRTTSSASAVAANDRSVPAIVILKYGEPR